MRIYMLICEIGLLLVGTTQEALRRLQEERDRNEPNDKKIPRFDCTHLACSPTWAQLLLAANIILLDVLT